MASKRHIRRKSCERKKRYDTKQAASNDAYNMIRFNARGRGLHVYKCDFCGGWHVGHRRGSGQYMRL